MTKSTRHLVGKAAMRGYEAIRGKEETFPRGRKGRNNIESDARDGDSDQETNKSLFLKNVLKRVGEGEIFLMFNLS